MEPIPEDLDRSHSVGSLSMANKFRAHIDPASALPMPKVPSFDKGQANGQPNPSDAATGPTSSRANPNIHPDAPLIASSISEDSLSDLHPSMNGSSANNQVVNYTPDSSNEENPIQRISAEIALETHLNLNKDSAPEDVCRAFVRALSAGDHIAASKMLTNVAQIETARANLELESPGSENAIWQVLDAEYATAEKKIAQVRCLLKEPDSHETAHLTWLMRLQENGWKISGMSIQISGTGDVDLLSFENPLDLQRVQSTVDTGASSIDPN